MLRLEHVKTPGCNRVLGETAVESGIDGKQLIAQGASLCLCRKDVVCAWCHFRTRIADAVNGRLSRQAIDRLMREGA